MRSADKELQPAYRVIEKSIADKAFPGATLAVGYHGKVAIHAFGKLSYDAQAPAVTAANEIRHRVTHQSGRDHNAGRQIGGRRFSRRAGSGCQGGTVPPGMGRDAGAKRMAQQGYRAPFAHAHFRAAAVQGILADFQRQARYFEQNFCGAAWTTSRARKKFIPTWALF